MGKIRYGFPLAGLPDGYSGRLQSRRFGVTVRHAPKDAAATAFLPELAGTDIVASSLYRVSAGKGFTQSDRDVCRKVVAFVLSFDRTRASLHR